MHGFDQVSEVAELARIFISHTFADGRELARSLADALGDLGHVLLDPYVPRADWNDMRPELLREANLLLILLTPDAITSESVEYEINFFLAQSTTDRSAYFSEGWVDSGTKKLIVVAGKRMPIPRTLESQHVIRYGEYVPTSADSYELAKQVNRLIVGHDQTT